MPACSNNPEGGSSSSNAGGGGSNLTHLWEVVDEATKKKNSHHSSTPTSPVTKDPVATLKKSVSSGERKLSSQAEEQKKPSHFLEGFRLGGRQTRTKSDDFGDEKGNFRPEGIASIMQQQQQQEQPNGNMARRWSESSPSRTVIFVSRFLVSFPAWLFLPSRIPPSCRRAA